MTNSGLSDKLKVRKTELQGIRYVRAITLQLAQRGEVTLPKSVRDRYDLQQGDCITLLDLDGVLVLSPRSSEVDLLADRIGQCLAEKGETLDTA